MKSLLKVTSLVLVFSFVFPIAQAQADGDWLDRSANWNRRFGDIPQAPNPTETNLANCAVNNRRATLPEDRSIELAGWTLYGHAQTFGSTKVISAMADADGMCRPLSYQVFVFNNGNFVGTLSPRVMNSRTDGSLVNFNLYRENYIVATFNRYTPQDALCCASGQSRVIYQLDVTGNQPILVPKLPAETNSTES